MYCIRHEADMNRSKIKKETDRQTDRQTYFTYIMCFLHLEKTEKLWIIQRINCNHHYMYNQYY